MNENTASETLAELGHLTRLKIYRILVRAGDCGMPVSAIQDLLNIPGSTLSHHISRLVKVGLVKQNREGRVLRCIAQYDHLNMLITFLTDECCSGV